MKTFSEQELKKTYPKHKTELCYVVAEAYDDLFYNESFTTDNLKEAKAEAKTKHYHMYIFTKKLMKDCLDTNYLLENLVDNVEQEGVDSGWLWDMLSTSTQQEFHSFIAQWFNKIVGKSYITDEYIGELVEK